MPQMEESGVSQSVNNPSPWKCRGIACLRPLTRLIARSLIPISRGASDPFLSRPRFAVIPAATSVLLLSYLESVCTTCDKTGKLLSSHEKGNRKLGSIFGDDCNANST